MTTLNGLGPAAADIVKSWQLPGVKVNVVHQLVPELIAPMGNVRRVLFIDAAIDLNGGPFAHHVLEPKKSGRAFGHHETPANLLARLLELEGQAPNAWLLSIAAFSFGHGDAISDVARSHLKAALVWLRAFLTE
ncbi:MAG: hypothetical protein HYX68_12735 [Planctomycetes bacterium]|nr:hypothetical protein [Planctomycetota bacterium]